MSVSLSVINYYKSINYYNPDKTDKEKGIIFIRRENKKIKLLLLDKYLFSIEKIKK